jgi:hypothetical protein
LLGRDQCLGGIWEQGHVVTDDFELDDVRLEGLTG